MMRSNSSSSRSVAVVARLLLPDDANPAGNVHGGTTLRLMEEAGMIAATRHMTAGNSKNDSAVTATLVRFENMSFHEPLYVGEVASLSARPIFTSEHSILIQVVVTGENVATGKRPRVTNTGKLWYVPLLQQQKQQQQDSSGFGYNNNGRRKKGIVKVPQIAPILDSTTDADITLKYCQERAKLAYEARKKSEASNSSSSRPTIGSSSSIITTASIAGRASCLGIDGCLCPTCRRKYDVLAPFSSSRTPAESEQSLSQVVLPGDCYKNRIAFGGFVMKLMDNAAGCSAFRHCRTNVVTVAISSIDFVRWVRLGDVCTINSKVVFCSRKTLEIEVHATVTTASTIIIADHDANRQQQDTPVAFGRFTFASLDESGKAIAVPPLKLENEEDMERAFPGQQRYIAAKKARTEAALRTSRAKKARYSYQQSYL